MSNYYTENVYFFIFVYHLINILIYEIIFKIYFDHGRLQLWAGG
jgi:hypothetical protein